MHACELFLLASGARACRLPAETSASPPCMYRFQMNFPATNTTSSCVLWDFSMASWPRLVLPIQVPDRWAEPDASMLRSSIIEFPSEADVSSFTHVSCRVFCVCDSTFEGRIQYSRWGFDMQLLAPELLNCLNAHGCACACTSVLVAATGLQYHFRSIWPTSTSYSFCGPELEYLRAERHAQYIGSQTCWRSFCCKLAKVGNQGRLVFQGTVNLGVVIGVTCFDRVSCWPVCCHCKFHDARG